MLNTVCFGTRLFPTGSAEEQSDQRSNTTVLEVNLIAVGGARLQHHIIYLYMFVRLIILLRLGNMCQTNRAATRNDPIGLTGVARAPR